eukprot:TRINITY_DN83497_c0_g1_i1.p1 TRINITY_DN83497_c0_g1~~TRINITY_DN83497_c0_g1_i1.p1  ORF type:complete len:310 (-),score=50.63 TRINITY_DN83497_c0_g1_i1:387-1316(-)
MFEYYGVLGVEPDAAEAEIKQAYHRRSLKVHPDKAGGSTEAFQELDRAYKVLIDADAREQYDKLGIDLKEGRSEAIDAQIAGVGSSVAQLCVATVARTALGGLFVLLLPHYRPLQWLQGIIGLASLGIGWLPSPSRQSSQHDAAGTIGMHLISFLASGWLAYGTERGRRWKLAWLYEARVVFVASGCSEAGVCAGSKTKMLSTIMCSFLVGRLLGTHFRRWLCAVFVECIIAVGAPALFGVIGGQAAKLADARLHKYAREVLAVIDREVEEKLYLQRRVATLESDLAERDGEILNLKKQLRATAVRAAR